MCCLMLRSRIALPKPHLSLTDGSHAPGGPNFRSVVLRLKAALPEQEERSRSAAMLSVCSVIQSVPD